MLNAKDLKLVNALITCVRLIEGYNSENIIRRERGLRSKLNLYDDACEMKKGV